MTPKEYKNKMMVKVVGSTLDPKTIQYQMRGIIYEVTSINYEDQNVWIKSANPMSSYRFNLSDVQIATPVMYDKQVICLGDKVLTKFGWLNVYDYIWWSGKFTLVCDRDFLRSSGDIIGLDPLYKEVKEELAVGSEVEIKTKEGKIYKATINNIK